MKNVLMAGATALFLALGTAGAAAQVGVEIGPGGVRVGPPERERVIVRDRRLRDDDYDRTGSIRCRTVERERVNRFGETVVERERRCR